MNGWFIAAGTLLIAAFFVHVVSGNRFYTAACPGRNAAADKAYEAWLMGRCGVQMITADLALGAVFLLLLGFGVIPRNFQLELFLLLTYGGWFLLWLVSLGYERAAKTPLPAPLPLGAVSDGRPAGPARHVAAVGPASLRQTVPVGTAAFRRPAYPRRAAIES